MTLTDQEKTRIRQAVIDAERQTRGEIVPMVIPRSARYQEARYRAGIACAFLVLSTLLTIEWEWMPWGWHAINAGWLMISVILSYGLGYWLGRFEWLIRFLTSHERMAFKVTLRAHQAFLEHGLHRTELGTGVLILVSLLEHRIEVLTDRPILDQVPQHIWEDMVAVIREGFQKGNPVESLCRAIATCGEVLASAFPVEEGKHNPNELPNDLIGDT